MTRKRFVKLVMSRGFQRNAANRYADAVSASQRPYGEEWGEVHFWCTVSGAIRRSAMSAKKATKAVRRFALAIRSSKIVEDTPYESD